METQAATQLIKTFEQFLRKQQLKTYSYSFLKIALCQPKQQRLSNHISRYDHQCEGLYIFDKIVQFKVLRLKLKAFMQVKKYAQNNPKLNKRKAMSANSKREYIHISQKGQPKKNNNKSTSYLNNKNMLYLQLSSNNQNPEQQINYSRQQNISILLESIKSANNSIRKHIKTDCSLEKSKVTGYEDERKSIGFYQSQNSKKINDLISIIKESRNKIHKKAGYHMMDYNFFGTPINRLQRKKVGTTERRYLKREECQGYCCIHGMH